MSIKSIFGSIFGAAPKVVEKTLEEVVEVGRLVQHLDTLQQSIQALKGKQLTVGAIADLTAQIGVIRSDIQSIGK